MSDFVTDLVAYHARIRRNALALEFLETGEQVTWGQFEERVARTAGWLASEFGAGQGDRVAVIAENDPFLLYIQFACFRLGAMFVPYSWRLAQPELEFCCKDIDPVVLVHDQAFAGISATLAETTGVRIAAWDASALDSAQPRRSERVNRLGDTAQLLYTSGTTGTPKAAICTYNALLGQAMNVTGPMSIGADSRHLATLPFFHAAGVNALTNPVLMAGGCVVIAKRFDPAQAMELLSDPAHRMTHFSGAPAMFQVMMGVEPSGDFSTMVMAQVGGGYLAPEMADWYGERGLDLCSGYGATEMGPSVTNTPPGMQRGKPGTLGIPVQHVHLRVVDADGKDVATGEIGEVWVSGPAITTGYWRRDVDADNAFEDGWFRSGDAVRFDEDGYFWMTGRFKDMYKSGGENVFMAEVETVLAEHPAIAEVSIIGVLDDRWGEVGRAVVVPRAGANVDIDSIREYCLPRLAKFKIPASVVVLSEPLPRNVTGKVVKADLRDRFGDAPR